MLINYKIQNYTYITLRCIEMGFAYNLEFNGINNLKQNNESDVCDGIELPKIKFISSSDFSADQGLKK